MMARFLCIIWDGGGYEPPFAAIAQELRERGHEVIFAGYESQRSRFAARGFAFVLLPRADAIVRATPPERLFQALIFGTWACSEHREDLQEAIAQAAPDVLFVECLMFSMLCAAVGTGLPIAVMMHSAPGLTAPPGGDLEAPLLGMVNDLWTGVGRPAANSLYEIWAAFPTICVSVPELDPLALQAPPSFAHVGPAVERAPASGWHSPWLEDDPRPLLLVSFSTFYGFDQISRIWRTLEATAGSAVRVIVTSRPDEIAGLTVPENAVLAGRVPHGEILPRAALTVTHAGHGTVCASLAHGVPQPCMPNPAADQPALAAQVAALNAGRALDGQTATPVEIAAAIRNILSDRAYAETARRLGAHIAALPGAANVPTRLEVLAE